MYKVLIISYANWDSLMEIPAMLKNGGCTVDVYSAKDSWALQNKFYDKWIPASDDTNIFLKELFELVNNKGSEYSWIIPGDDLIMRLLNDTITDEQLFYKMMPLSKIENRVLLGSKAGFSELCSKYDISTPRYLVYDQSLNAKKIGDYIGYPLMMKTDKSEAGAGVFLCENEASLAEHINSIADKTNLVFQQYITGYDINMEVLYKNGELMVYSYSRVLTILGKFGLSTRRLFYYNQAVEAELVKAGRSLGISGFASVAFMYSEKENKHYLIEIDVRPNSWVFYGQFLGNDFSEGVRRIAKGDLRLVVPDAEMQKKQIKISHYKKDMAKCIVEKDIKGVWYWVSNQEHSWDYIPRYDKKLLRACNKYLWWFFTDLMRNKVKKVFGGK